MIFKYREALTKEFLSLLASCSQMKIDILLIHHDALFDRSIGKRLLVASNVELPEAFRVMKEENLWWKNAKRGENVYIAWSRGQLFNIATVDDIMGKYVDRFKAKDHFLLVQTSQKKYQGYFLLDHPVDYKTLHKIQKVLCKTYNGDKGALSPVQLKRSVGFINTKYADGFVVRLAYSGSRVVSVDRALQLYKKWFGKKETHPRPQKRERFTFLEGRELKTWKDFECDDLSVADMRYACYLVRMGLSDEEIARKLLEESPNIEQRHKVEDYIPRTIRKAKLYVWGQ